jgi:hypothetical protein
MASVLPADREAAFWSGVEDASRFFMGEVVVQRALKRLADVLELVRALSLPRDLAASLDASVRAKYEELWEAAQTPDRG